MIMPREIEVEALRARLERGENLTILDVRPASEREEWFIPGSVHHDAYHALAAKQDAALADVRLPAGVPVVTVCGAGKTSVVAADQLAERGFEAYSLAGGMKAWSLAWNTAEAVTRQASLIQFRRTGKGCLSYLIGSGAEAVVVDPSLDPEVYLTLAAERGWTIRHVLDTHVHADHLSRGRHLAKRAGASFWLPEQDRARYQHRVLRDNDEIRFGASTLRAIQTPGHTMESVCYQVDDAWLLTGDTLFPAAVGRPDLEASPEEARARALLLHQSLRRLFAMDAGLLVLPNHSSRPIAFDRRLIATTLGDARHAIQLPADAEAFADSVLRRIPPTPPNHHTIVALNEVGVVPTGDPTDLEAGANRCAVG